MSRWHRQQKKRARRQRRRIWLANLTRIVTTVMRDPIIDLAFREPLFPRMLVQR